MENKSTCGISAIIKATGMKRKDILAQIEAGRIEATKRRNLFEFAISEKDRLEELRSAYAGFCQIVRIYSYSFHLRLARDRHRAYSNAEPTIQRIDYARALIGRRF